MGRERGLGVTGAGSLERENAAAPRLAGRVSGRCNTLGYYKTAWTSDYICKGTNLTNR